MSGRAAPGPVIATFEGSFDPATRTLSIRTMPLEEPGALSVLLPWQDGTAGSGPANTFELVTDPSFAPTNVSGGCGGGVDSFDGDITVRSFFRNQTLRNVYAELTSVSTGYEGCNSATAVTGVSAARGLWSYGTVGPAGSGSDSATRRWKFRFANSARFTFQGRIMADLDAPVPASGPEFDWTPTSIVIPPRSFQPVGTTMAHIVWTGTDFVDAVGTITFVPQGSPENSSPGLASPPQPYVRNFSAGTYFVADEAHGGNAFDTAGDFTACVKFKPGAHPGNGNNNKVLFGKGTAEPLYAGFSDGWALMQMHSAYCFHYRTLADGGYSTTRGDVMSFVALQESTYPEMYTFDYMCGGRAGDVIHAGAHGVRLGSPYPFDSEQESGTFADRGQSLPLVIGAYPDGRNPAVDGGVYEVIVDSRPVSLAVMNEIVTAAEGRQLPGSPATLVPTNAGPTSVTGADGGSYTLPSYATVPLAADGSGLLAAGTIVKYTHPLAENTSTTGFCVGAELVATGPWSSVVGGVLQWPGTGGFNFRFGTGVPGNLWWASGADYVYASYSSAGWTDGSAHVVKTCVQPGGTSGCTSTASLGTQASVTGTIADLSGSSELEIANGDYGPLTGARVRRVFACPTSVETACN